VGSLYRAVDGIGGFHVVRVLNQYSDGSFEVELADIEALPGRVVKWGPVFADHLRKLQNESSPDYATGMINRPLAASSFRILKGLFKDTLPSTPELQSRKLAFVRCDGDLYESIWQCLRFTYHLLSPGGYVYVDDYFAFRAAKQAVDDFLSVAEPEHGGTALLQAVDEYDDVIMLYNASACHPRAPSTAIGAELDTSFSYIGICEGKDQRTWKIEPLRLVNAVIWRKPRNASEARAWSGSPQHRT